MASTAKKAASADNDQRQKSLEEPPKTVALDEMTKAKNSSSLSLQEEKDIADSTILEQFAADKTNFVEENTKLPKWLYKYLLFRFNLLDRTGEIGSVALLWHKAKVLALLKVKYEIH